ncbi:MAG: hypothetical protein U1D66_15385 [Erythrobacter sp.]|nr:hypothetical protein [Erythrobacter sp.]
MMKPEPSDLDQDKSDGHVILKRALIGLGGGLALIFIAGMIAGFASAVIDAENSASMLDAVILAAMLAAALAIGYAMWRFWPRGINEPEAPRIKSARLITIVVAIVSVPLGVLVAMADGSASNALSNAPVSPVIATASTALWLIAVPVLSLMWWRRVDEHEAGAYREGAFVAVHAYLFLVPSWWMASRAGWLPEQDPMIVLLIVSAVWTVVWFLKRYF